MASGLFLSNVARILSANTVLSSRIGLVHINSRGKEPMECMEDCPSHVRIDDPSSGRSAAITELLLNLIRRRGDGEAFDNGTGLP